MADYGGAIGGKFRKRPFRKPAATPYDRPPAALRAITARHVADLAAEGRGGWISKLVDPASRLISSGASKFFSTVFRKRLTAPPQQPPACSEGNQESRHVPELTYTVPESACTVPSSELQRENGGSDNMRINAGNDGIAELEQLLKQKTFTRAEFERLAELLRSRTVEPSKVETEINDEKHCDEYPNKKKESMNGSVSDDKIGSLKIHESSVIPRCSIAEQTASPAELAKAYMVSKPSSSAVSFHNQAFGDDRRLLSTSSAPKAMDLAVSFCNQAFGDDKILLNTPSAPKAVDLSVAPRSTIRFSGIPEHTENGYRTPRPLGRSAMFRMSRSPYFKVNSATNIKGGELNGDGNSSSSSLSQWTPRSAMQSGDKQVLKRGSSVLDGDFGSVGPIRRIRQKSNLNSPLKDQRSSVSGSFTSSPSSLLLKQATEGSTSVQKTLPLGKTMYETSFSHATRNGNSNACVAPIPSQSSETAHRLFQQLDKLLPSPKEKSSAMKIIDKDESPSKLTPDMLHGKALRSMEDIDSSKFSSMADSSNLDYNSKSQLPALGTFPSVRTDMVEAKGHSNSAGLGVKFRSEVNGTKNASAQSTDVNSDKNSAFSVVSDYVVRQPKRPAFQMSAPEDSFELDDDENMKSLGNPKHDDTKLKIPKFQNVISGTVKSESQLGVPEKENVNSGTPTSESKSKIVDHKATVYDKTFSEPPMVSSSTSTAVSGSIFGETNRTSNTQPAVAENTSGYTSTVPSNTDSKQRSPTTSQSPFMNQPALEREQMSTKFGSGSGNIFSVSSAAGNSRDTAPAKVDVGTGLNMTSSTSHVFTVPAEGSNVIKVDETQKAGDLFKSLGQAASPGPMSSTPALFAFGASTTPSSLSNGSLGLSSTVSVPTTLSTTQSGTPASLFSLTGTAASPNNIPSLSSAASVYSTIASSQFGSGTKSANIPALFDKSKSVAEVEPTKTSIFSSSNATASSTTLASMSSSSATNTLGFSNGGIAPAATMTSGVSSSTISSSFAPATSSLFSSMGGGSSSSTLSPSFPSTAGGIFGFGGTTQSSTSSPSFLNSSSQNLTTTFGSTGGLIFGAQSSNSAEGTSQKPQSSTAQVTSFPAGTAFGLNNSSSSIFSNPSVGSATSDVKPFTSSSGFSFTAVGSSSASTSSSFVPAAASPLFGSTSQATSSPIFGSTSVSTVPQSTTFSFGQSAPGSGSTTSPTTTSSSSGFSFGLSAPGSGSGTPISSSSPATGFSFGQSASGTGSSPFMFGSSSSPFSFNSANPAASTPSTPSQPLFGSPNPTAVFGSMTSSPGNDQMNVEDSMTDDSTQAQTPTPSFPTFGQPANQPAPFTFGSPAVQTGAPSPFQFGSGVPQNPAPFQAQGGSFSLGSGGGDKAGRKIIRVNRNRKQKK